jgi:hypothetical protein
VYNHAGLVPGYQSIAECHRDIDAVVIPFTGPTNFEGYVWNLSEIVYNRIVRIPYGLKLNLNYQKDKLIP